MYIDIYTVFTIVSVFVFILFAVLHELMHYIVARLLGYSAVIIKKPLMMTLLTSIDINPESKDLAIILLAPLSLTPLMYLAFMWIVGIIYPRYMVSTTYVLNGIPQTNYTCIFYDAEIIGILLVFTYIMACLSDIALAVANIMGNKKLMEKITRLIYCMSFVKNMCYALRRGKYNSYIVDFSRNKERLLEKYNSNEYIIVCGDEVLNI